MKHALKRAAVSFAAGFHMGTAWTQPFHLQADVLPRQLSVSAHAVRKITDSVPGSPIVGAADIKPTPLGTGIDILGLRPGQTPDQVRAIMKKTYPSAQVGQVEQRAPDTTDSYVQKVQFVIARHPYPGRPGKFDMLDVVGVVFSSPASGNMSVAIRRQVSYVESARPLSADVMKTLEQKYGQSADKQPSPDGHGLIALYSFDENGEVIRSIDPAYLKDVLHYCQAEGDSISYSTNCGNAQLSWRISYSNPPAGDERINNLTVNLQDNALFSKVSALDARPLDAVRDLGTAQKAKP